MEVLKLGMEMLANQKREPTTSGGPEDNSPEHSAGSSDSIRHTSECAIAFGIRGCRRSSDDRQVGGLGETTSYRSGRVAFFHDIFVPSFFPPVCLEENDAEYLGGMGEKGCGSIKTGSRRCLKTVRWVRLPAVGGSRLHRWWHAERGDGEQVRIQAHTIKGAAGNISARLTWETAAVIEAHAREGRLDAAIGMIAQLQDDLQAFQHEIGRLTADE